MRRSVPLLLLLAAAGCAPIPRPTVARAPAPPPAIPTSAPAPPPPAADWRDWPATPGTWSYARDTRGSVATFGQAGADAAATLRCDPVGHRLLLARAGSTARPMTVRTSSMTRQVATAAAAGAPPQVAAALAAGDPLLDAIAFSRGRFALEQTGAPPLVLPAWAEVGRVIEDCRE